MATVESIGTSKFAETGRPNGKLQLSLDPNSYNRSLTADKVNPGMLLQGTIEGKEQKGFVISLGFKDNTKAFLKFDENVKDTSFATGNLVQVVVKTVTSKMVKCELLTKENAMQSVKTDISAVTLHTLKPGFFVSAKVSKIYENGVEVSFLGGLSGTVFADHLGKSSISKFKIGEKVQARVISVDIAQKNATLSLQPHLLNMTPCIVPVHVGQVFENVKVERNVYGSSFIVKLTESTEAFLHKSHIPTEMVE